MPFDINVKFEDPLNFIYDSNLIEVSGGACRLKDQRPSDATFFANYELDEDGNWGDGTLAGTLVGATVGSGVLSCVGAGSRCDYNANLNADSQQVGCIRFGVKSLYTGAPANFQTFFNISKEHNSNINQISFGQDNAGGGITVNINDSTAAAIISQALGTWLPVAGTVYEFELNWDLTTGETRLFIAGVQLGITMTGTGIRDADIGLFRMGNNRQAAQTANLDFEYFMVFDAVQHTANYTVQDYTTYPSTIYSLTNPTIEYDIVRMESLDGFVETSTVAGLNLVKHLLKKNASWFAWNGTAWVVSNENYGQTNTEVEIDTNVSGFTDIGVHVRGKSYLHSEDGSTTPVLRNILISYDPAGDDPDVINYCNVWGYQTKADGEVDYRPVVITLSADNVKYKTNRRIRNTPLIAVPRLTNGYWEKSVAENENMEGDIYYNFDFGKGKRPKSKTVPNQDEAGYETL